VLNSSNGLKRMGICSSSKKKKYHGAVTNDHIMWKKVKEYLLQSDKELNRFNESIENKKERNILCYKTRHSDSDRSRFTNYSEPYSAQCYHQKLRNNTATRMKNLLGTICH